jgi:hypothetical protein
MFRAAILFLVSIFFLNGCVEALVLGNLNKKMDRLHRQTDLMQSLMKEPDLPSWYTQRTQIVQAMGDRVFEKNFERVFGSVTVALASMDVKVDSMERQSGYIGATGMLLPPGKRKELRREQLTEYCRIKGYDPTLLDKNKDDFGMDPDAMGGMDRMMTGMTVSLVKQGPNRTKVKLRFKGIYYPKTLEECYKVVWPAIDKQIFMDKGLD